MRNPLILLLFLSFLLISCEDEPYVPTDGDNDQVSDIDPDEIVNIPDENLRKCVLDTMSWKEDGDAVIYADDAARVEKVECNEIVEDLIGLEYFVNTTYIILRNSKISTLEQLTVMRNLELLQIDGGRVTDLTPLENHEKLRYITLIDLPIENLNAFSDKENIQSIKLNNSEITTLEPLKNLSILTGLSVNENPHLTTLGAQFNTPLLESVGFTNNALESLDGLSGLPELTSISAEGNMLTDVEFMTTLPKLDGFVIRKNCLDADALGVWVDWVHEAHGSDTTVEEQLEGQNPDGKCGY